MERMIQCGVYGFVLKTASAEELMRAVQTVASGRSLWADIQVAQHLSRKVDGENPKLATLTDTEREVLGLIANGASNKAVAHALALSLNSVQTHRENLMRKLNTHSIAGLTKFALVHGLVTIAEHIPRGQFSSLPK